MASFSLATLFEPDAAKVPVIDPVLKHFGRVWVPIESVEPTKALKRWANGIQQQPSLCMLQQTGQCHGGFKCNQIHIPLPVMDAIRVALQSRPFMNCCHGHGDLASKRSDFQNLLKNRPVELNTEEGIVPVLPEWLAMTTFFDCYIAENLKQATPGRPLRISPSRVCNLHQRQECKYGPDCRNVHLCRQFWSCLPSRHKVTNTTLPGPVVVVPGHLQGPVISVPLPMEQGAPGPVERRLNCDLPQLLQATPQLPSQTFHAGNQNCMSQTGPDTLALTLDFAAQRAMLNLQDLAANMHYVPPGNHMQQQPVQQHVANHPVSEININPVSQQPWSLPQPQPRLEAASIQKLAVPPPSPGPFTRNWSQALSTVSSEPGMSSCSTPSEMASIAGPHFRGTLPHLADNAFGQATVDLHREPVTLRSVPADDLSSQGDCDFSVEDASDSATEEPPQGVNGVAPGPDPWMSQSYAELLAQQTIFQSLTFDLLDDASAGIDLLPWALLKELQDELA